jgi:putative ABC transport system permease protein
VLGVRWYKVLYDLWGNKTRTALIVLSIAVGLFAVGVIVNSRSILSQEITRSYAAINPSSGTIRTVETFDEDFVRSVGHMDGVQEVDARAHIGLRFKVIGDAAGEGADGQSETFWRDIQLYAVPDYDDIRVNKIRPQTGAWPPPQHELLLERSSLDVVGAGLGERLLVETADRNLREMRIVGVAHDLCQMPSQFDGMPRGYISFDTLDWLGEPRGFNELHVIVQQDSDSAQTLRVLNKIKDRVEKSGYTIPLSTAAEPGEVPLNDILQAILMLLGVLGFLSLFLSAFLVVNTTSALVTQQIRQIGVMKAVGARAGQIVGLYLALVVAYGMLALTIAVPLGAFGARVLSDLMAGLFNFDLVGFHVAPGAIALQVAIGLLVPVLSALYPILTVLRISAAEAMTSHGMGREQFGTSLVDRLLTVRSVGASRMLYRPLLLSLRNTFRRKGRLALTLATLTLGGAMFIAIFSVRSSLDRTLADLVQIYRSDVWLSFADPQRATRVEQKALEVPGVVAARAWERLSVRRMRLDGSESESIILYAVPADGDLVRPVIVEGRWLLPEEHHAVVATTGLVNAEPGVQVGADIVIKVDGREATFRVVGVALGMGLARLMYADYADVARVTHDTGQAGSLMVVTQSRDTAGQALAAARLESHFRRVGVRLSSMQLVAEDMEGTESGFNMIIVLALVMAFLLALVGGLGLMGTLGINVLERTREIGVMRAVGASDGAVARVFIVEGVVIGAMSWAFGACLAAPLSGLLSDALGMAFMQAPLSYAFSYEGVVLWLLVVLVLSSLASFVPARSASRLTVREVLAYE